MVDGVYPADEAHLRPILEESRVLERLVDDLRTLSLAESGALPLHREPTDPTVLLDDVAAAHRARAAAGGVDLRVETPTGEVPTIDVDPVRTRQVIANLVDNAIRAMPDGGTIRLAAEALGPAASRAPSGRRSGSGLAFEVVDDGPGIPDELRSTVFDRFTKSPTSRGSGLGLAIARAIVEAHGGSIAVATGPDGRGTRFRIELP
ncbi:MAG TPA: HAMP domain-containing sensor histidine kinase, partial [Candidatus Limnocylindrales bacterium]|nr:HAMP domain-containing sensor histidine kinase [Candidatus Limnocylindrales bacterium]